MALHGKVKTWENPEDGVYICVCEKVELVEEKKFQSEELEDKFKLTFKCIDPDETDSEGRPWKFIVRTGVNYGHEKANLTKIITSMEGRRLTNDEFLALDLEEYIGRKWKVMWGVTVNEKGEERGNVTSVKPYAPKKKAPVVEETEDEEEMDYTFDPELAAKVEAEEKAAAAKAKAKQKKQPAEQADDEDIFESE